MPSGSKAIEHPSFSSMMLQIKLPLGAGIPASHV